MSLSNPHYSWSRDTECSPDSSVIRMSAQLFQLHHTPDYDSSLHASGDPSSRQIDIQGPCSFDSDCAMTGTEPKRGLDEH
jgi:hypothetical protein